MRRRALLYALLALAVPLPALAIAGSGQPANLSVSSSLSQCGLVENEIVCTIEVSWNAVDGAESYSVSVTRPDGSVIDAGRTAGTGVTVWVPYAGDGAYSVQVTAWGSDAEGEPPALATEESFSTSGKQTTRTRSKPAAEEPAEPEPAAEEPAEPEEPPAPEEPTAPEEPCAAPPEGIEDPPAGDGAAGDEPALDAAPASSEGAAADAAESAPDATQPAPAC